MDFRKMTEPQLKLFLNEFLDPDFHFASEVVGKHIVEEVQVVADYILRPKSHLIEKGFDDVYFAIEVKSPKHSNPHSQYRKALVQAASYADSRFGGKRPLFTLIFPQADYFKPLNAQNVRHDEEVSAYFRIGQYFSVGDFRIHQPKDRWCIWFSGGRYFCSNRGRGPHNLTKRYVGNIS
ncbi:MAG: hypothetical protein OHK0046_50790 [Anaerolineae bacterium]